MRSREKDAARWLHDIRHNIHLAQRFVQSVSMDALLADDLNFYAVTRCLEIISEASRRLPQDLKDRHPDLPWVEMAAAGNVYRHEYEDVAQRRIWGTVKDRLPELLLVVEGELRVLGELP